MFPAEKDGLYEPVKIRRKEKKTAPQQDGQEQPKPEADEDEWEEDHVSEEGAVWPMKGGRIVDWPAFYALLTHVFKTVNPPFHTPILLIGEPVWTPKDRERIAQFVFESFKVPAFSIMDAAMAATYAYGVPTATVVDVGLSKADITCVSDFVLHDIGRSIAVLDCGGDAMTRRLVELLTGRKGFNWNVCEQLKKSNICEILANEGEMPTGAGAADEANPAAAASTGLEGASGERRPSAVGDIPRGPGQGTEVGPEKLEDDEGVLDIASIVTGGNMSEYLAKKEQEKAEKAAARQKKGSDAQQQAAAKPVRLPNNKRLRNSFMYEDFALHDAMKKAGMSTGQLADMSIALDEHSKRQKTPEPMSATSDKPADAGLEGTSNNAPGSTLRREIEVGIERFQAASGGVLDRLADAIYRTVQSCSDISRRSELWDNMIIVGNGSKVRGFKEALLVRLSEKYLISPSSATIFTSELPSNLSTPIATGANTPQPQQQGQHHPSGVNPLLLAATTAQQPHLNPSSSGLGQPSMHSHTSHAQTPTSIKLAKIPEYFPEWKEVGYDEATFLGAQVAAKVLFVVDGGANNGYMTRTNYNDNGPTGIHEVSL